MKGLADGSVFHTMEKAYLIYENGLSADKSDLPNFNYQNVTREGLVSEILQYSYYFFQFQITNNKLQIFFCFSCCCCFFFLKAIESMEYANKFDKSW